MKQWGSAENREGVARRAILVDMPAPAQPLIIYQAPRVSRGATPHSPSRDAYDSVREEWRRQGGNKKKEATLTCLLVFVRDRSVHVKHGPRTCRLEMKLPFTCSRTLPTSATFAALRIRPEKREGDFRGDKFFSSKLSKKSNRTAFFFKGGKIKLVGGCLTGLNTTPLLRTRSLTSLVRLYRRDVTWSCTWEGIHQ